MEQMRQNGTEAPSVTSAPRQSGWRHVGMALLFLAAYFLVQFFVTAAYALFVAICTALAGNVGSVSALIERVVRLVTERSVPLTGVIDLASLGAFALILRLQHRPVLSGAGLRRVPFTRLWPLIPLGVALNVLLSSLISLLPADVLAPYMEASSPVLLGGGVLSMLILAVLAPVTEEVLFRGLIYGNLRNALPRWLAVVLSAAVFGLLHGQLLWMLYTALLGAFFCVAFERYGSLLASILLHMSFNAGSFLVLAMQNTPVGAALALSCAVAAACGTLAFRYGARDIESERSAHAPVK